MRRGLRRPRQCRQQGRIFARRLHDGVAQDLAYLRGEAAKLGRGDLVEASDRALREVRTLMGALGRAEPLGPHGAAAEPGETLADRIERLLGPVLARTGCELTVRIPSGYRFDERAAVGIAQIVREAVTNAARHGSATVVYVTILRDADLVVRVFDNGTGFDVARAEPGFGLCSISDLVGELGGTVEIDGRPGIGTALEVRLPSGLMSE